MAKNAFIRMTALHDVRGRITYATSPEKQEHLEAYVDNMPKGGWGELSKYSRKQAALYHPGKKVCEARELIIKMQNDLSRFDPQQLAIALRNSFSAKHKVPCAVAIHWNTAENNYHAHLIFSERAIYREKKGKSIATRNTYFDANGKRSTKKDCLDEFGNLKPGCRIVKKGKALNEGSQFGAKKNIFAQEEWLRQEKKRLVDFINANTKGEKWNVYDWKTNPHLPYIRINKGEPAGLTAWKSRENDRRKEFNESLDKLLNSGEITSEQALKLKFEYIKRSRELKEQRKIAKKQWIKEWKDYKNRRRAEWEYTQSLRHKSTFVLVCELALMMAGVDMVKLKTGIEKTTPSRRTIKVYQDKRIQAMIDDMYIAAGKSTPSELALIRKTERLTRQQDGDLKSLIGDANENKEKNKNQNSQERKTPTGPDDR